MRPINAIMLAIAMAMLWASALAVPTDTVPANSAAFEATAKNVDKNGLLRVTGHVLEGETAHVDLELTRVDIWAPDAIVLVDDVPRPAPKTAYFRGHVVGDPDSTVSLSVREKGGTMGMVTTSTGAWVIGKGKKDVGALKSQKAQPDPTAQPFSCGQEQLPHVHTPPDVKPPAFNRKLLQSTVNSTYQATIAIETDYEYYAKFASRASPIDAALDYAGDLMGYADVTYSREIDTDILIGFIRIFTQGAASDPYATTTSSGTALDQLRAHWLNTPSLVSVKRTVVHMLSGMSTGGGVAYVGVLCNPTYGFGYSGALSGTFSWDENQNNNPANLVWDNMVVQHEMGHNFNSPHTHDYCGIDGVAEPVDYCWSSTSCGTAQQGLPACTSTTPYFKGGAGTIMSYCHQVGGYAAIAMTFGGTAAVPHTCGNSPLRVPNRMKAHVVSTATAKPTCITRTATCGNGVIETGEQCDGINLNGANCATYGFTLGGALSCINCQVSTANCVKTTTPPVSCKPAGSTCTANSECCSINCRKNGRNAKTCA